MLLLCLNIFLTAFYSDRSVGKSMVYLRRLLSFSDLRSVLYVLLFSGNLSTGTSDYPSSTLVAYSVSYFPNKASIFSKNFIKNIM